MSLSDLASLGSFVSGAAVLVSLVYLSLQIRQNSRHTRALIHQGRIDRLFDMNLRLFDSPNFEIAGRGAACDQSMTEAETMRFRSFLQAIFISFEEGYQHHCDGLVSADTWEAITANLKRIISRPGNRAYWTTAKSDHGSSFVVFVDGLLAEQRAAPIEPLLSLKDAFAAELAALSAVRTSPS